MAGSGLDRLPFAVAAPSGSSPMAAGRGLRTRTIAGKVPKDSASPTKGAAPLRPRWSISKAAAGATTMPPKESPVEAMEKASAQPAGHQRGERHEAAGTVAQPEHEVEGVELPQFVQGADRSQRQRSSSGAGGDDDARVAALDQ